MLKAWRREVRVHGNYAPLWDDFVSRILNRLRHCLFAKPKASNTGKVCTVAVHEPEWFVCMICRTVQDPMDAPVPWVCEGCHPFAVQLWRRATLKMPAGRVPVSLDRFVLNLRKQLHAAS